MISLIILRLKILFYYFRDKRKYNIGNLCKKNIFVFLGADYGNLGDVAITYAQVKYLKERYSDYNVVEIPISETLAGIKSVKRVINRNDVIVLIGGGNTGDLYDDIEWLRQLVIMNFRKHQIIGFPQTFDFSNTRKGYLCRCIAHYVYKRASFLTLLAREKNTMDFIQCEMKGINVTMVPDIVMTLDERIKSERKGVLVCMRSDKEKAVSDMEKQTIINNLREKYKDVVFQDTQINGVNKDNRYDKLFEVVDSFRKHELVITDRLHGMILCFITGTPALVFDNSNHKISACFNWIKDCGYIRMIRDVDSLDDFVPRYNFEETHDRILQCYKELPCLKFH